MNIKMKSTNHPKFEHEITLVPRDNEILIITPDGREIATLSVQTMEADFKVKSPVADETGRVREWETHPTNNFWVCFKAKNRSSCREAAEVYIEDIKPDTPLSEYRARIEKTPA